MAATRRDPYSVLGVDKKASAAEIKKAYRKLARQYHPDRNAGDKKAEERFKEISEANDLLSDPEKRAAYDRGDGIFGGHGPNPFAGGFDGGNFSRHPLEPLRRRGGRRWCGAPCAQRRPSAGATSRPRSRSASTRPCRARRCR